MQWYPCWSYRFQNYDSLKTTVKNLHQKVVLKNNITGKSIRVLLSNQYGQEVLHLDHMKVRVNNQDYPLTYQGCDYVNILPDQDIYSDAIEINICAKENIMIEMDIVDNEISGYVGLNSDIMISVQHNGYMDSGVLNKKFNSYVYFGIKSVEVMSRYDVDVITAFGDSLVHQGYWMNHLFHQLYKKKDNIVVLNEGVSGNRLLRDATSSSQLNSIFQIAGIKRFEKDIFQKYHPNLIIFAEGINDLVHPGYGCDIQELPTLEEMKKGYRQIMDIVQKYNSKLVFMTMTPFHNYNGICSMDREYIRQDINQWLREKQVIDIDLIVGNHNELKTSFDGGDHLHFNENAGRVVATQIVDEILRILEKEG